MDRGRTRRWFMAGSIALLLCAWGAALLWLKPRAGQGDFATVWRFEADSRVWLAGNVSDEELLLLGDNADFWYGLDRASGDLRFSVRLPDGFRTLQSLQRGAEGRIVFTDDSGRACALDSSGQLAWDFSPRPWEAAEHAPKPGGPEAVFYSCTGRISYGLSAGGELLWAFLEEPGMSVNDYFVDILIREGKLYRLNETWRLRILNPDGSSELLQADYGAHKRPASAPTELFTYDDNVLIASNEAVAGFAGSLHTGFHLLDEAAGGAYPFEMHFLGDGMLSFMPIGSMSELRLFSTTSGKTLQSIDGAAVYWMARDGDMLYSIAHGAGSELELVYTDVALNGLRRRRLASTDEADLEGLVSLGEHGLYRVSGKVVERIRPVPDQ